MPVRLFTNSQRQRLDCFPSSIEDEDIIRFFTLSDADRSQIPYTSASHNRLGFAIQLCVLRFMGFVPGDLMNLPYSLVEYVAGQLELDPSRYREYGTRIHTRTSHLLKAMDYLGYRRADEHDLQQLSEWLLERSMEHDKPILLYELACERLRLERILRPGLTRLERLIAEARQKAHSETMRRLGNILTDQCKALLNRLLLSDQPEDDNSRIKIPVSWLRQNAVSNSPKSILQNLEKLTYLKQMGVHQWELDNINSNRLKRLAQIGRRSTTQALQRSSDDRRYSVLIAFLHQSLVDIVDESIDMFDRCLAESYARAGRELDDFRRSIAKSANEKIILFRHLGSMVLDPSISDAQLRTSIYRHIPPEELRGAVQECDRIVRPTDDGHFDFLRKRYNYMRQFIPAFLDAMPFHSNNSSDPLIEAIELLRELNSQNRRSIPYDAPMDFVTARWHQYVVDSDGKVSRPYYELCVLWELRNALRSGDIWLEFSRRYANPQTYLIPKDQWNILRPEVCRQIHMPEDGMELLRKRGSELESLLSDIDGILSGSVGVRKENDHLLIPSLQAQDEPPGLGELEQSIDQMLPRIELSQLLIEVDRWTKFSQCLTHANTNRKQHDDMLPYLYASIMAHGCNIGISRMAHIANLDETRLQWCNHWYIRGDTLKAATNALVDFHYHQPLSNHWGGGVLSSSDGQRFPVSGRIRNATALPRYFGYGRGVTFYTWTSDQFSQYGTKVIPATVRDATYVLDEILDNETELPIMEHSTDTTGYTEIVFALFDLLGLRFSPRIRDLADQRLYQIGTKKSYPNLESQIKGGIRTDLISNHWDDLLRVAGSLKLGWVTASLLIGKLQSYPRQNALTRALREYGRLIKSIFILRYLKDEEFRRKINAQLNKGESLHALRRFLFFAHEATIRRKQLDAQSDQALCLNLITNAVIVWNTVYMDRIIGNLATSGHTSEASILKHLSPTRHAHINPYGQYRFELEEGIIKSGFRPLRKS